MRIFVTNILPHHLSGKYKVSYAASNFSWALINSTAFDRTFSIAPANVVGHLNDVDMKELVYSNWREKGRLLQRLAPFKENLIIFKNIRKGDCVWFYNISLLNILLFFLCRWLKPSVQCNVIILDIFIPKRTFSLDSLFLWAINHANATIRLSNSARFTCKRTACLPGVVSQDVPEYPKIEKVAPRFLLSGLLREDISQIFLVMKVFSQIPNAELFITGFSDNRVAIEEFSNQFSNIHFYGELPFDEYIKLLHTTPFLLSTRDPKEEGNQCNFPSKIIEGLLHNRIIVSTIKYEQLNGLNYFCVSSDEDELRKEICQIISMPAQKIAVYANQSGFVRKHFNPNRWREIMSGLEAIVQGSPQKRI